jgi:hypothetical protein
MRRPHAAAGRGGQAISPRRGAAAGATLLVALASAAGAQEAEPAAAGARAVSTVGSVTPRGGYARFDRASSIRPSAFLAVDATYQITPAFAVGPSLTVARASTYGEDYLTAFTFGDPSKGDTTFIFANQQPVTVVDVGAIATARLLAGSRFAPYLTGGVGAYSLYLDPQQVNDSKRYTFLSAMVGGGVDLQMSQQAGIRLDVRDQIFMNYDRRRLNPADARFQNTRFVEDLPAPPANKSTLHNLMFSVGFTFRPAAAGEGEGGSDR